MTAPTATSPKLPRQILDTVFAFPPNRETLGATAYLIVENDAQGRSANLLVDTPAWHQTNVDFLQQQGGVRWLCLSHRGAIGQVNEFQKALGCEVVIQEQEAYLLPQLQPTTFQQTIDLSPTCRALWTPGYSPGSACLYYEAYGGVLFTGRHLLPDPQGRPTPLRFSKTFHWPRQLRQVQRLAQAFSPETLAYLCPAANTGFLRGDRIIANAYEQLQQLDLEALRLVAPLL
ncbi:hypothetical protein XM38_007620 [Halomicronema hongdechloris C2206]|uniref:Metallo-beta-lactamase domain-containing protein n=1 Tax=Halomicronema hongdechloris C2206 TaxID=1641165 RepID=A0A1Z3HHP1_9CYAN|nr:MBL fold metallo-hydrolase [Halomicronema hongdechloris]ASC69832.1 hypothetical protein XM38_007620 [Halomicronema hongdechloris C2206]